METRCYCLDSFQYISKSADDTSIYEADDEKTTSLHTTDDELACDDTTTEVTSDDVRCSTPKRGSKRRLSVTLSPVRNEQSKQARVSCSLFSSDDLSASASPTPSEFNFQLILFIQVLISNRYFKNKCLLYSRRKEKLPPIADNKPRRLPSRF